MGDLVLRLPEYWLDYFQFYKAEKKFILLLLSSAGWATYHTSSYFQKAITIFENSFFL